MILLVYPELLMNPASAPSDDVTGLLERWSSGDARALEELVPIVYQELRKVAASRLRGERHEGTLPPTALVHEVYLQLRDQRRVQYNNRSHFFGAAARIIRRILVDRARERQAVKRGGEWERVPLQEAEIWFRVPEEVDLVGLDDALEALAEFDPQKAKIVELRYFAGFSVPEVADALDLSATTIKREWAVARAWLYERLSAERPSA
jgi:RNA polymerase sigma factor (TIGR02999 family)